MLAEQHQVQYQDDDLAAIRGLFSYLFDEETRSPDLTQQAAIALARANVISDHQFITLLSLYVHHKEKAEATTQYDDLRLSLADYGFALRYEKNVFVVHETTPSAARHELPDLAAVQIFYNAIEAVNRQANRKTIRYTLSELLAQCQTAAERDDIQQDWLDASPVGIELIIEKPDWLSFANVGKDHDALLDNSQRNHAVFMQCLDKILRDHSERDIVLEIVDFANELGMVLGLAMTDHARLVRDFQQGFTHGVDLARREVRDQ